MRDAATIVRELVQIPSVNPMGRELDPAICYEHRLTHYLLEFFTALKVPCAALPVETVGDITRSNVVATVPGRGNSQTLMLQAHQDTVPVDGMTVRPFEARLQDGRIYGRGACDIKGALGTLLAIAARLVQSPPAHHPQVSFAFTMNEECGFTGATALSEQMRAGRLPGCPTPPTAIIVSEPTGLDVVVSHKGVTRWRCHTHGRAGHSSAPAAGVNAIYAMSRVVERLRRFADETLICRTSDPRLGRPTLSVGTIQGGISVNTIPDQCTIEIDRRTLPSENPDEARDEILQDLEQVVLDQARLSHDDPFMQSPGLPETGNALLAQELAAVIQTHGRAGQVVGAPYGTDAAALAQGGIPTVVFGPGQIAQAHTKDEWVEVAQLQAAEAILWEWLCRPEPVAGRSSSHRPS